MQAKHRLDPLLKPARIALVGVSNRTDSPGQVLAKMVVESDYAGEVYLVNPRYQQMLGQACYLGVGDALQVDGQSVVFTGDQGAAGHLPT